MATTEPKGATNVQSLGKVQFLAPSGAPPHLRPLAIFWGPKVLNGFGLNEIKGSQVDVLVTFN